MKQAILFTVFFTALIPAFSRPQLPTKVGSPKSITDSVLTDTPGLEGMLADIMKVCGSQATFELKQADVRNLQASVSHHKKYILYNPLFIDWVSRATGDKWAAMFLLAHEIGHHVNGHTKRKTGSKPHLELEADEYAGAVLRKLGATLEEAQEIMIYIARPETSNTHPGRAARMQAIRKGWEKSANS